MRATLRRACDACAKAKLSCDLRTPQCSRCVKRKSTCAYANEPLTTSPNAYTSYSASSGSSTPAVEESSVIARNGRITPTFEERPAGLLNLAIGSFDPFDSYPPARLPRVLIQHLIHHCKPSAPWELAREKKTNLPSLVQYRIPVLSAGSQYRFKPIHRLMVASSPCGPRFIPCLVTDGVSRPRAEV